MFTLDVSKNTPRETVSFSFFCIVMAVRPKDVGAEAQLGTPALRRGLLSIGKRSIA